MNVCVDVNLETAPLVKRVRLVSSVVYRGPRHTLQILAAFADNQLALSAEVTLQLDDFSLIDEQLTPEHVTRTVISDSNVPMFIHEPTRWSPTVEEVVVTCAEIILVNRDAIAAHLHSLQTQAIDDLLNLD